MANISSMTYGRVAEVLQQLGMVSQDRAHTVVEEWGADQYNLTPYDVACSLVGFGVAVRIHADDIDFLEESYASLLNAAAAVAGGAVTVANVRLHEGHATEGFGRPDFAPRDDVLEFERNGQLVSIPAEHFSEDYYDIAAAVDAVAALDPDDDPRAFHLVEFERERHRIYDTVMALVSPEQARALEENLGLQFPGVR